MFWKTNTVVIKEGFLEKLFYQFPLEFDKYKASHDYSYGEPAKPSFYEWLYYYRLIYLKLVEILDALLVPKYIEPHKNINVYYPMLVNIFNKIGKERFSDIHELNFKPFTSFAGDIERMIMDWKRLRGQYIDQRGLIENAFSLHGSKSFPIPYRLGVIFGQIDEILEDVKKRGSLKTTPSIAPLPSGYKWLNKSAILVNNKEFKISGKRNEVLRQLFLVESHPLRIDILAKNMGKKSAPEARNIVGQINERLAHTGLQIEHNAGFYWLTISSSTRK